MGTKVHSKSYLPGYYSMRDLNEDSSSNSWPVCYGDKAITSGQYYNGFMTRAMMDGYPGCGKDALKQKMLEHEAVFRNQVYELHRLYRIQRDLMEEVKRKELNGIRASMEPSSSSSLRGSQVPSEDARKWHMAGFPLMNSVYERTSVSGVEIVNSPMSCTKGGNNSHPGQFPYQNGSSRKGSELLDSRPLKVRKKLFDLELPADEYMDAEDDKTSPHRIVSDASIYAPNGKLKNGPESRVAETASASRMRNSIGLADLNEPVELEEAIAPLPSNFFGHGSIGEAKGVNPPSTSGYIGVNDEKRHHRDGFLINSSIESKVSEGVRLSHIYGSGSSNKSNLNSLTHGLQQDKLPMPSHHSVHGMLNPSDHPLRYPADHIKEDLWRVGKHHGLESSDKSHYQSNYRDLEPHLASKAPRSDPFFSSYFSGSWGHSSWARPSSSFTPKMATLESCSNSAADCREAFVRKWIGGDSSRLNPSAGVELTARNGFYHGSASGPKEIKFHHSSLSSVDYFNHSRGENVASDHTTNHGFGHFPKGSCCEDSKPLIDINLNEVVLNSSSNEAAMMHEVTAIDEKGKPEDHLSALPWLKNKPAHASSSSRLSCKAETVTDLNLPFTQPKVSLASSERKAEISENQSVKKILGVPIFESSALVIESSSHVSTPPYQNTGRKKNIVIDINLECEPEEQIPAEEEAVEKEKKTNGAVRDYIDLNSCVTDCEDILAPSYESKTANVKMILDIDLESPVLVEDEDAEPPSKETKTESPLDEVLRCAAESVLSIASSCFDEIISDSVEASVVESLMWFVDAVTSCDDVLKSTSGNKDSPQKDMYEEMDDFEAMTLQIPPLKEEDYMPMAFVPELVEDTVGNALPTRTRRVQSRRGRQRRDFQRDILPGIASLSRHEVTEDLQMFGGLMRATGHHWISGLTRRNGGGRGRRRAVVESVSPGPVCSTLMRQLNSIEGGLEDRSLTGWGKTTRRPRRQRCPAGNPPAVVIT